MCSSDWIYEAVKCKICWFCCLDVSLFCCCHFIKCFTELFCQQMNIIPFISLVFLFSCIKITHTLWKWVVVNNVKHNHHVNSVDAPNEITKIIVLQRQS